MPLADASFDLAISEYGAAIWCDPYRWIPEAARLLRGSGFDIEDLIELRPSGDMTTQYPFVTLEWARHRPSEEIWVARRRHGPGSEVRRLPNHE